MENGSCASDISGVSDAPAAAGSRPRPELLVATKVRMPALRKSLVARPRLTGQLDRATGNALTLLSAPPGYGKTSLVVEWLHQGHVPAAWLSLDEGDNDPARFWAYVAQALAPVHPEIDHAVSAPSGLSRALPLEQVVAGLINALSALDDDVVLVLDDYHVVESPAIQESMAFLLQRLPPRLHVVIISRTDPPLPLALLRGRGDLLELRAADLRFTAREAADFLGEVMGVTLSDGELAALEARTDGWVAGLQLAALGMRGQQDPSHAIAAFAGTHRFMLDYLTAEVLQRQPEEIQRFLLQTSILDRLTAPLVEEVTGRTDGQAMLERVERSNLFLLPLDDERGWYRYHDLFAEYLRKRLRQQQPDLAPLLHRRAARWYDSHESAPPAISHALAGGDAAHAATLIARIARVTLMRGELDTLQGWLDALPGDLILRRPDLCLLQAWIAAIDGRLEQAERFVEAAFRGLGPAGDAEGIAAPAQMGEIAVIRSLIALVRVDLPRFKEMIARMLPSVPETSPFLRAFWLLARGFAHDVDGETDAAARDYLAAAALSRAQGNLLVASIATSQLGDTFLAQGQLHRAAETYGRALDLLIPDGQSTEGVPPLPLLMRANADLGLGLVRYEWDDLDAARQSLERVVALGRHYDHALILAVGAIHLARVRQAQGDPSGAREALREATRAAAPSGGTLYAAYVGAYGAMLEVIQGDLDAAARWARSQGHQQGEDASGLADLFHAARELGVARVLIAQGHGDRAMETLTATLERARAAGHMATVVQILALQSLARARMAHGDGATAALDRLGQALALAEPEGYIRTFADEGAPMAALLARLRAARLRRPEMDGASPVSLGYLDRLLHACGQPAQDGAAPSSTGRATTAAQAQPLIEPLTERELDILRLVDRGLSGAEIAGELVLSLGTVYWHIKNIHGKLGVRRRTQAVARARELGLL